MAENDSSQEKTEEATPRRREQAREKGQVARSKELGTSAVLLASAVGFVMVGPGIAKALALIMTTLFSQERSQLFDTNEMFMIWSFIGSELALPMLSLIAFLAVVSFIGNIVLGGITFSVKAFMPKADKMSPLKGFKRMFGVQALVELTKGIAKFSVVALSAYFLLSYYFDDILALSREHLPGNVYHSLDLLAWMFILLCSSTLVIVVIDVPFQVWNHNKQLKMTKQEIKDEYKDTEGKPEVKQRIRQKQREIAMASTLDAISEADVIVTNPSHFAVALSYAVGTDEAPKVVAKGADFMAKKIRERAEESGVIVFEQPQLARALYFTTEINHDIPRALFEAVAEVIAYVFKLNSFSGNGQRAKKPNLKIPSEMNFDENGEKLNE